MWRVGGVVIGGCDRTPTRTRTRLRSWRVGGVVIGGSDSTANRKRGADTERFQERSATDARNLERRFGRCVVISVFVRWYGSLSEISGV